MSRTMVRVTVAVVALLVSMSCSRNTGSIAVLNNTQERISRVTVTTSWGEKFQVSDIDPSKAATVTYMVQEGDYRIEVAFQSGRRLRGSDARYVTSGLDFQDQVIVTSSEIRLITGQAYR